MKVRAEQPHDLPAVREVVRAAFGEEQGVHHLLDALRDERCWLGLSFVAVEDDEVVGHVAYTRAFVDDPRSVVDVLVLSPLSVRPDRQAQGIGTRLVTESLSMLAGRPEPVVFLEGDPRFYRRVGFEAASERGFTAPSVRIPPPGFQVHVLPAYDGSVAGAMVYPEVWWRHDAVGLRSV
jgi:putative acetyltransferase